MFQCLASGGLAGPDPGHVQPERPAWGRGDGPPTRTNLRARTIGAPRPAASAPATPARQRLQPGPPDLDELWRDFNRKLGGLLGGVAAMVAAAVARRRHGGGGDFSPT
jgi:membrane protease subunit HflK